VVTAHEDEDLMLRAIRAGAAGYVLKGDDPSRLIAAVRQALSGDSYQVRVYNCALCQRL
jgi:DNA-binding NarL/FixJ family response regulator